MSIQSSYLAAVPMLSATTYKKWLRELKIAIGLSDLDIGITEMKPEDPTENSSQAEIQHMEKWENANKKCSLVIQRTVPESILDSIPDLDNAKRLLEAVQAKYEASETGKVGELLTILTGIRFDGTGSVRDHITYMEGVAEKLKGLKNPITQDVLIHFVLNSLPDQYKHIRTAYKTAKDKWTLDELTSVCNEEEKLVKQQKIESANLTVYKGQFEKNKGKHGVGPHRKGKNIWNKGRKPYDKGNKEQEQKKDMRAIKCFWCKKSGHMKKDCRARAAWLEKDLLDS